MLSLFCWGVAKFELFLIVLIVVCISWCCLWFCIWCLLVIFVIVWVLVGLLVDWLLIIFSLFGVVLNDGCVWFTCGLLSCVCWKSAQCLLLDFVVLMCLGCFVYGCFSCLCCGFVCLVVCLLICVYYLYWNLFGLLKAVVCTLTACLFCWLCFQVCCFTIWKWVI